MINKKISDLRAELNKYIENDSSFDSKLLFLKTLADNNGNIIKSCSLVNIKPSTVSNWKVNDAIFKQQLDRIMIVTNDVAESALLDLIEGRDASSVKFYLERRMSDKYGQNIMTTNVNVDMDSSKLSNCSTENLVKIRNLLDGKQ